MFLQCPHNSINLTLLQYTTQKVNMADLQHHINYERHSSVDIVTDLIKSVRRASMSFIKKAKAAARKKVQELFDTLNRVQEALTYDSQNQAIQDENERIKDS